MTSTCGDLVSDECTSCGHDIVDGAILDKRTSLQYYLHQIQETILRFQNPITGLFASHLSEGHAWIRDNTYSVHCCWGLCLAYKKLAEVDEDLTIARDLENSVVKCMRSLLVCMMLQSNKVECFKKIQHLKNSLHAKYNAATLRTVVGDFDWGHLQIDAVSLYLLTLAQMTASGLQLVYNLDEVAFIQNLVFYIELAYQIPDYGIWERGDKTNHGLPELNSTSIGMTKAALEAIDDLDLFGSKGGPLSIVHVLADESQQCSAVLDNMLPRESYSKETDAGLLGIIGYPAFAVDKKALISLTRQTIIEKLAGRYGCCRFLRDGHHTAKEDKRRLHYEPLELKVFENIEAEWPLFTIYLLLEAIFRGDNVAARQHASHLDELLVVKDGLKLVPEAYTVPIDLVDAEYALPHSQKRETIGQLPHIWAQSLYLLGNMMLDGLLQPGEVDPLGRRMAAQLKPDQVVQVVLVAEDLEIQEKLASYGFSVQTFEQIYQSSDVKIYPARILGHFYRLLGKNQKLGLTGRQSTAVGILSTSKLYRIANQTLAFTPQFVDHQVYYLSHDVDFIMDTFQTDVTFLCSTWKSLGRPLFILPVNHWHFSGDYWRPDDLMMSQSEDTCYLQVPPLIKTLKQLQNRYVYGARIVVGNLLDFMNTSCTTQISFLDLHSGLVNSIIARADRANQYNMRRYLSTGTVSSATASSSNLKRSLSSGEQGDLEAAGLRAASRAALRRKYAAMSLTSRDSLSTFEPDPVFAEGDKVKQHLRRPLQPSMSDNSLLRLLARPTIEPPPNTSFGSEEEVYQSAGSNPTTHIPDNVDEMVNSLARSEDLYEQFEIIVRLLEKKGLDWDTNLDGRVTVRNLLDEVYDFAGRMKQWWLARTTAGLLRKRVEDLSKALTDLIVRQKQVTVGPPSNERVIERPLSSEILSDYIYGCWQMDPSMAMFNQEILVYLAMFARTEARLFDQMIRIRVGLIIEVMLTELMRAMHVDESVAEAHLMNLSPFEVKKLLHHILSGREFRIDFVPNKSTNDGMRLIVQADAETSLRHGAGRAFVGRLSKFTSLINQSLKNVLPLNVPESPDSRVADDRLGQWIRRRIIDGSLNRVPPGFYRGVWKLLVRYHVIRVGEQFLKQNLTQEMTEGEVKFALQVEGVIMTVPIPEYRQLLVEALCILGRLCDLERSSLVQFDSEIVVDNLVLRAHEIYLEDQRRYGGISKECCAGPNLHNIEGQICPTPSCGGKQGLCLHFYDSAPSGRFGTMSYLVRALFSIVRLPCRENGALDLACAIQIQ